MRAAPFDPPGRSSRVFEARFPGLCGNDCGDPIEVGDDVMYDGDDLVHASCVRQERRQPKVCPRCFIAHAGECF